ncbi:serine O-acetyltransferase [Amaricoccus sp. W119]|uniref:serine O-acetyltransferase n=1 Tax=Amaricoccus sp. W119 TaxID=3391833 RepID=UPI0039A5D72D
MRPASVKRRARFQLTCLHQMDESTAHARRGANRTTTRGPDRRIASFAALREHWREDFVANDSSLFRPGFIAVANYRFGVWAFGIENAVFRAPLTLLYVLIYHFVKNVLGIELHYKVRVGRRLRIGHQHGIVIHRDVQIGDDCLLRQNVTIGVSRLGVPREEVPVIGDRVEIGAGAVVLSPARIGDDVLIGPNTVVRRHVPPRCRVLPPDPVIQERRMHPARA